MHRKDLLIIIVILSLLLSCNKTSSYKKYQKQEKTEEELRFIFKERKKYFMELIDETQINTMFEYYNNTNETLLIDTIMTHCGCTNVQYSKKPIFPNEKGAINVTISPPESNGFFSQGMVVYFHKKGPVTLHVYGKKNK